MNRRYGFARFFAPKVYFEPDAGGQAGGAYTAGGASTDGGTAAEGGAPAGSPQTPAPEGQAAQTFTLEEVTRLIQSEADKRVTQALQRQQREYERKAQLSGLNDSERALAEKDDEITRLNDQLRELNGYKARSAVF